MAKTKMRDSESISQGIGSEVRQQNVPGPDPLESTFSGLREQIEARLASSSRPSTAKTFAKSAISTASGNARSNVQVLGERTTPAKGKKRDHMGKVLPVVNNDDKPEIHKRPKHPERTLEQEMQELGGSTEDLQLMLNIESESEMEGDSKGVIDVTQAKKEADMEKGLQNILREISLVRGKLGGTEDESDASDTDLSPIAEPADDLMPLMTKTSKLKTSTSPGLKCDVRPDWFNASYLHQESGVRQPQCNLSGSSLNILKSYARDLLETENQTYAKVQQKTSSNSFYNTVIASGTLSDKISALTLAIQESPTHNVKALETLIGLAKKRSRAQAVDVLRALKDLFAQGSLLPSERRLYTFAQQPGLIEGFGSTREWNLGDALPFGVQQNQLVSWSFEDFLKEQYFEMLKTLEIWCNDEIEFSKSRAVNYVYELLKEKPEQESNLLRLLINKLGDPIKKIASQTSYLLLQLLGTHPAMKQTVISAIEADFLFRPGQSMHGKYYAIVTLNQTVLNTQEDHVAVQLLGIYFSLFRILLKPTESENPAPEKDLKSITRGERRRKKSKGPKPESKEEEFREKFIAAILTGVNRAYPYSDPDGRNLSEQLETLFRITHSSNFNTSIQAMMLIQQMASSHQVSSDRFYRTLYESLLDARLVSSSKQQLYLNLLHRSLKADLHLKRVKAFVKRILQILSLHDASFICAAFFLLKDLEATFPALRGLIDQMEEHEEDEEVFKDVENQSGEELQQAHRERLDRLEARDRKSLQIYDGRKRDPEHSHADNSCAWELLPYLTHFHPAVSVSAEHLSEHALMPGKPDLALHTLIHFLDRFVYKNPKLVSNNLRGSSVMQPMASSRAQSAFISSITTVPSLPVNTDSFRNQKDDEVAAQDVFFHKYFSSLGRASVKQKAKTGDVGSDDGSIGDEDAVWKAMMASAPNLEGAAEDSDDDLSFSDLESELNEAIESSDAEDQSIDEGHLEGDEIEGVPIFDDFADEMDEISDGGEMPSADNEGLEDEPQKPKMMSKNSRAREQRRKMKALPVFASAADYEKMLEDDGNEDLG